MATARFLGAPWSPFAGPRSTDQPCLGPILLQGAAARIYALKWLRIHDQSVDTAPELRVGEEMNTYVCPKESHHLEIAFYFSLYVSHQESNMNS